MGRYSLSASALPNLNAAPAYRTLRRETPGFSGCAERRGRKVAPTPIGLVVLPHDWGETLALSSRKASPSWTAQASPHRKPGVSRRKRLRRAGAPPPTTEPALGRLFSLGRKFLCGAPQTQGCSRLGGLHPCGLRRDVRICGLHLAPRKLSSAFRSAQHRKRRGSKKNRRLDSTVWVKLKMVLSTSGTICTQ